MNDTNPFLHRLCRYGATLGVTLLIVCALVTVADVVSRRTVGLTIPGLIDLTQLLVMSSVFLCIPYAFAERANVEVDLLFDRLPRRVRVTLSVLWPFLGAGFLLAIAWHVTKAGSQVLEYGETSPTLAVPMIWYWVPILLGVLLSAIVCIQQMWQRPAPT